MVTPNLYDPYLIEIAPRAFAIDEDTTKTKPSAEVLHICFCQGVK